MMMRLLDRARRGSHGDRGIALPIVLGLGLAMTVLIAGGLTAATSGLRQATTATSTTGALDAAYAGVQDYLVRLNNDATYPQYGNPAACVKAQTTDPTPFCAAGSVTMPSLAEQQAPFGLGTSGTWANVAGSGGRAQFRYEVDNSRQASAAIVRLRSTGRVGNQTRSIVVSIKRDGFINYLYFTDFETADPAITGTSANCAVYAWAGRDSSSCSVIQFAPTDVIAGPVHSNDTIVSCGATFNMTVSTANPNSPYYSSPSGCGSTQFKSGTPVHVPQIAMPASNGSMSAQARTDLTTTTGCLYTGPTTVQYNGDGTMTVWSPWTKFTNIGATKTSGTNPAKCGDISGLHSSTGSTVNELNGNLLFVQTVPPSTDDPNYSATTSIPSGMTCFGADGKTKTTDAASSVGWSFGPFTYPLANEAPPNGWDAGSSASVRSSTWSTSHPAYGCKNGDLYVRGTVTTQTTAASDDYVYVIDDLKLKDLNQDVLGLVGNNAVLVWNPVDSNANPLTSDYNREIDASILSVQHTFQVQNYDYVLTRGSLTVVGSIAQKFRGPVGQTYQTNNGTYTTGYSKNYKYDQLLASVTPPYFLAPSTTTWSVLRYSAVPPVFDSTGALQKTS